MASGSITSWQIDGETMKTGRDFIFLGSKITVDSDCSHEIKRSVLLGRKAMTKGLQHIRLLRPWDFPGNSTGVGCHFLLQGIFPTQGLNAGLPHCRQMLYSLSHQGSPMTNLDSILKSREDITLLKRSIQSKLWFFQQSCMDVRVGP